MSDTDTTLPIASILDEVAERLTASPTLLLQAPPGSGKTTRVPLAMLDAAWLAGRKVLVLEPRRLAATNAARYMASLRNEQVGQTVGYAIRYQRQCGPKTRIEVITEGLLTQRLQRDPELQKVGLVIFDEFHERSLHADLALALCREVQTALRPDLRILVMSATLDLAHLATLLDDCPVLSTKGRSFPVSVTYGQDDQAHKIAESCAQGIRQAINETRGDVLAFLPGRGEIVRCQNLLQDLTTQLDIRPLYGNLPFPQQESAILPGQRRRVVLATNVAETSLTIEGIETVVDSGWERRPYFDAARGMTRLDTVRISRASAEQRAGRAGRLGPGHCYRLWSEGTQGSLLPFAPAEIRQADLAPLAFELARWGISDPNLLCWLNPPPAGHLHAAQQLLSVLGATDQQHQLSALGHKMAAYPTHPRLSRLLVAAVEGRCTNLGCELVALLSEPDFVNSRNQRTDKSTTCDILERLERLDRDRSLRTAGIRRARSFWQSKFAKTEDAQRDASLISQLLASAFPDRIAHAKEPGSRKYRLSNGQGAYLSSRSTVRAAEFLVAVETHADNHNEMEIRLASTITRAKIEELFGSDIDWQRQSGLDQQTGRVAASEVRRLGSIILQRRPAKTCPDDTLVVFLDLIRRQGLEALPWSAATLQFRARAAFVSAQAKPEGWPDWSETVMLKDLQDWLAPFLAGVNGLNDLQRIDLDSALKARLGWQRLKQLDRLAPERIAVPSGSRIRLDYSNETGPVLAVKLQELFGLATTPCLAGGKVPILIHLLSPAGRPLAVTKDLENFWNTGYPEVKKEMKGRYPKHPWPDDPWHAEATGKTKRRQATGGERK